MAERTVRIGDKEVTLRTPRSPSLLADVQEVSAHSAHRALSAALGMCWTGASRPRVRLVYGRTAEYGGRVYDELIERGMPPGEILEAAGVAYQLVLSEQLGITWDEVAAMADFSEAPGDSTS